jgi:hypothetical protein
MEADWEVEIGAEAPVIEALWPGFIDLWRTPERIREIEEAQRLPALATALVHLNHPDLDPELSMDSVAADASSESQIWTSKCDLWVLNPTLDPWDLDELDAAPPESVAALACYIDMVGSDASVFARLDKTEAWARAAVYRLREIVCRSCRADLVIRRAFKEDQEVFGITVYTVACGADAVAAEQALSGALLALVTAIRAASSNIGRSFEANP